MRELDETPPDVTVDFEFDDGALYVVVANGSGRAVTNVRVTFDPPFTGLGGTKAMNRLALFRRLEFLAAAKEIRTFLDSSASYFARDEPTRVTAKVSFRDAAGRIGARSCTTSRSTATSRTASRRACPGVVGVR